MSDSTCETMSVLTYVMQGTGQLTAYALHCKKLGLTYRAFVERLETWRRDVLRTPDGVLMNPECNDRLDMVTLTRAWKLMKVGQLDFLFMKK